MCEQLLKKNHESKLTNYLTFLLPWEPSMINWSTFSLKKGIIVIYWILNDSLQFLNHIVGMIAFLISTASQLCAVTHRPIYLLTHRFLNSFFYPVVSSVPLACVKATKLGLRMRVQIEVPCHRRNRRIKSRSRS